MSRGRRGISYRKRVADIGVIYEQKAREGFTNREIWRRFVYPVYAISERTFYNIINASVKPENAIPDDCLLLFTDEDYEQNR